MYWGVYSCGWSLLSWTSIALCRRCDNQGRHLSRVLRSKVQSLQLNKDKLHWVRWILCNGWWWKLCDWKHNPFNHQGHTTFHECCQKAGVQVGADDGWWSLAVSVSSTAIRWDPQRCFQDHCFHLGKAVGTCGVSWQSWWTQATNQLHQTLQPLLEPEVHGGN